MAAFYCLLGAQLKFGGPGDVLVPWFHCRVFFFFSEYIYLRLFTKDGFFSVFAWNLRHSCVMLLMLLANELIPAIHFSLLRVHLPWKVKYALILKTRILVLLSEADPELVRAKGVVTNEENRLFPRSAMCKHEQVFLCGFCITWFIFFIFRVFPLMNILLGALSGYFSFVHSLSMINPLFYLELHNMTDTKLFFFSFF